MPQKPDIAVLDKFDVPTIFVMVKELGEHSSKDASEYMQLLLVDGFARSLKYVMLITSSKAYIWLAPNNPESLKDPVLVLSMMPIIHRFLPRDIPISQVRGDVLEAIAALWLTHIVDGEHAVPEITEPLLAIGLPQSVYQGALNVAVRA